MIDSFGSWIAQNFILYGCLEHHVRRWSLRIQSAIRGWVGDQLRVLCLLELCDELLNQVISLIDELLESLIELILLKQVGSLVPYCLQLINLRSVSCDLIALSRDHFFVVDDVLWRAMILELLNEVFKLSNSLHEFT